MQTNNETRETGIIFIFKPCNWSGLTCCDQERRDPWYGDSAAHDLSNQKSFRHHSRAVVALLLLKSFVARYSRTLAAAYRVRVHNQWVHTGQWCTVFTVFTVFSVHYPR